MEIRERHVRALTPAEYRACSVANYRYDGYMQDTLSWYRRPRTAVHEMQAIAIMLWDGPDDDIKSLIGWALLTPTTTQGNLAVSHYAKKKSKYTVQFWVKRQYRRKGYGAMLMQKVLEYDPTPYCFPHDKASGHFFSTQPIVTSAVDRRRWLKKPKAA